MTPLIASSALFTRPRLAAFISSIRASTCRRLLDVLLRQLVDELVALLVDASASGCRTSPGCPVASARRPRLQVVGERATSGLEFGLAGGNQPLGFGQTGFDGVSRWRR